MDRINFSKSIDIDPVIQVRCYFNETMAMYDLVEGLNYNYNLIRGFVDNDNSIQFSVEFNTPEDATNVGNNIIGKYVSMYNRMFFINGEVNKTELLLTFIKQ